jgi:hypothetical protein
LPYSRRTTRPYFIGEKTSLKTVLQPFAERVKGELLLPTGEISDTLIAEMAARAITDKRPTIVFYFSDFEPSWHQMPISMARKLQTLRDLKHRELGGDPPARLGSYGFGAYFWSVVVGGLMVLGMASDAEEKLYRWRHRTLRRAPSQP